MDMAIAVSQIFLAFSEGEMNGYTTWQNSVTYNEIIRLSGILDEAQTTIPPYERPKIAKS
jgi:hypothetical protein